MKLKLSAIAILPLLAACASAPLSAPAQTRTAQPSVESAPSVLESSAPPAPADTSATGRSIVSAADPRAAQAGAEILQQGGSATDAAIAVMLALTVVEPQSSGIGGGGFFVRGDDQGHVATIDGRETAPAGARPDWFLGNDGKPQSYRDVVLTGLSVGVPGNVALAADAHKKFGVLPWARLFEPAIALAEDGFKVTPRFHEYLSRFTPRAGASANGKALFFNSKGSPLPVGTTVRNPALAKTLRDIAVGGEERFYRGEMADSLAETVASATPRSPAMMAQDVMRYRAQQRPPVCGTYRGYRICGMGPPSSGATTVLAILGQLERFNLKQLGPDSPVFWHLFAESQRLAYADRERYLADSDFVNVPVSWLTDPSYLAQRSALISPGKRLPKVAAGIAPETAMAPPDGNEPPEHGTSHFAIVDKNGNAVSYTSTVEGPFGSGLMFGGFYLNNELTDFSFSPNSGERAVANRVEGGKRPRSSMSPTLIYREDGSLFMSVGAAGGGTIPVQTSRAIIAVIDFGMTPNKALALPMLYSPGNVVVLEPGPLADRLRPALEALGHTVAVRNLPLKANAIVCDTERVCTGAADPRSEGVALAAQ